MDTTQSEKYEQLYSIRGLITEAERRLRALAGGEEDGELRRLQEAAVGHLEQALRALDFVRPEDVGHQGG